MYMGRPQQIIHT